MQTSPVLSDSVPSDSALLDSALLDSAQTTPVQVVQTQAQAQEQPQEPGQIQPQARPVEVVVARPGTLTATRITSVIVEPAQESRIAAGTDGRVLNVLKRVDTRVAKDEPVIILDTDTLELEEQNAVFEVESARVALQQAQQGPIKRNRRRRVQGCAAPR